ncbi:hypothetical protein [Okeania sp. SIO1I7]|nr:hypothetical protein [Okeania sp. SIO1I7]
MSHSAHSWNVPLGHLSKKLDAFALGGWEVWEVWGGWEDPRK